jgi:hypothetical protein
VHRGVGVAALIWATLIGVSTLYTEQHYFVDVIGGVVIAVATYALLLRGHDRATVPADVVHAAPRQALRAVWVYAVMIVMVGLAYRISATWADANPRNCRNRSGCDDMHRLLGPVPEKALGIRSLDYCLLGGGSVLITRTPAERATSIAPMTWP